MASTLQDRLLEIFAAIAGEQTRFPERSTEAVTPLANESSADVAEVTPAQIFRSGQLESGFSAGGVEQPASSSPAAVSQNVVGEIGNALLSSSPLTTLLSATGGVVDTVKQATESGGGVVNTLESIASKVFTSGFGLVSLFSGLFGLFGGGGQEEPPPLVKYALPPRIDFQAAETAGGLTNVDYSQAGLPRAFGAETQGSSGGAPAITVNVHALDARSFLDRSSEIAAAVRDAMLNLNSINDVVNEL